MTKPLVTIHCLVYNHAPFLRECLEGFVMQKTNFPFVAIVHDDASIDKSADIIREYAEKYPNIIHPIYETENQYSKGNITRIMEDAASATGATYFAICEGDDYWTDPYKLQKQVDFLEAHEDVSMCFTCAAILGKEEESHLYDHLRTKYYTGAEIFEQWTVPTCTVVYRQALLPMMQVKHPPILFGDILLFLRLSMGGKLYCIADTTATYRRHEGGVSCSMNIQKAKLLVDQYRFMSVYFKDDNELAIIAKRKAVEYCWYILSSPQSTKWEHLKYQYYIRQLEGLKPISFNFIKFIFREIF